MAEITYSDLIVYESQFKSAVTETIQQMTDAFNAGSNGAIMLRSETLQGHYDASSFFQTDGSLVNRQDITSVASLTPDQIVQSENRSVKLHRQSFGRLHDKAAKISGLAFDDIVGAFGQQVAAEMVADKLNYGILAARVALGAQSAVVNDDTAATVKTISIASLMDTLRLFGDQTSRIAAWVMHSDLYFDLGLASLDDDVTNIADGIVRRVDIPGLGRPILVTDSSSLFVTGDTPDSYYALGLVKGAIDINESETMNAVVNRVTGLKQLAVDVQSEWAYNVGVKGFAWDSGNGGINPDDSAYATTTNWDKVATSAKDLAGVVLKCNRRADV
jgi:hypothetical protein